MFIKTSLRDSIHCSIFILLILAFQLFAEGTTGLTLLKINPGSKARGMGGAYTALSSDLNGIFYNPAGPGLSTRAALQLYHANWIEDISIDNIAISLPMNRLTFTSAISYLHLPEIAEYDISPGGVPVEMGTFTVSNFVTQFGLAYRLSWNLSIGFQAKYVQDKLAEVVAKGFAYDFGILLKLPIDYLRFGFAVQNLGSPIAYEQHKEKLPRTYRAGIAYQFPYQAITFSLDGVKRPDEKILFYPGMEVEFFNNIALRGGVTVEHSGKTNYNFGVGFKFMERYQFNYVYSPVGIFGETHHAEFTFNFGGIDRFLHAEGSSEKRIPDAQNILSQRSNDEIKKDMPSPTGLESMQIGNTIVLSWNPAKIKKARYNLYIQLPGKKKIVKINDRPIEKTYFKFSPKVKNLEILIYLKSVYQNNESDFSKPLRLHLKDDSGKSGEVLSSISTD